MKAVLTLAVTGLLVSAAAFAQTNGQDNERQAGQAAQHANLRQQMRDTLQQAGFTKVKVVPDSFLVQAMDKSGHKVTMFINPQSMTEIVDVPPGGPASAQSSAFTRVPVTDRLSTDIIGLKIYDTAKQDIGTIKDIAYGQGEVQAYIVDVGAENREVAVNPSAMELSFDHAAGKWHAAIDTTEAALKAAPPYTPPSQG